ncbi:MAG: pantetheine-phosphate adenylyltransferase [Planctomycetes bacterium]|nr:pantetheine-phosphate adenylyltransferase [Planctomycetota bacterium]
MAQTKKGHPGAKGRLAVFPGTFDPPTNGHLDTIRRAARLFDRVIIGVGNNPGKKPMLPPAVRARLVSQIVADLPSVSVRTYEGLTVDFARKVGADVIIRGVRNSLDMQYEMQMAATNRMVAGVETVFIMADPRHVLTSSSLIRQIASGGGDVSAMVPPEVLKEIGTKRHKKTGG